MHIFFIISRVSGTATNEFHPPICRTLHCISQMVPATMMPLLEEVLGWMNHSASLVLINFPHNGTES